MFGSTTRILALALVVGLALVAVAEDGLAVEKGSRLARRPIFTEVAIPTASAWAPTDTAAVGLRELDCSLGARRSCGPSDCPCCTSYRDWWDRCSWNVSFTLAMWLPGMTGQVGTPNNEFDVDFTAGDLIANFGTVLEKLEFMLQGNVGVSKGPWSAQAFFSGMEFGSTFPLQDENGGAARVNATIFQWQVNLYYRAIVAPLTSNSNCSTLIVWEPYIGARINDVSMSGTDSRFRRVDAGKTWVDAVVGLRATWDLRNNWAFDVEGDVGGGMSNLTWKCRLGVNWRFARKWDLGLGWLWLDTDFEDGAGTDYFRWDVLQSGPYLAVTFRF